MRKTIVATFMLAIHLISYATQFGYDNNPINLALGGCSTIPHLGSKEKNSLTFSYQNNYFIPELGTSSINAFITTKYLDVETNISYYGLDCYGELAAYISFSRKFGKYISIAVGAGYVGFRSTIENGFISSGLANFSILTKPTTSLTIGFKCYNISFSKFKTNGYTESLPTIFNFSISYVFANKVQMQAQVSKDLISSLNWAIGIDYHLNKIIALRVGAGGEKFIAPSFGIGLTTKHIAIDVSANYNTILGISMATGITFNFINKHEK